MSPLHVVVVGHSFIRRLRDYVNNDPRYKNLRLQMENFQVGFRAMGGLKMSRMARDAQFTTFAMTPDIVFIQTRGNDLGMGKPVRTVYRDIVNFANNLVMGCEAKCVIIGQIFGRERIGSYNEKVVELNNLLKNCTVENSESNVHFHRHHGFWSSLEFLANDEVHIRCTHTDKKHMHKFLQSIKRTVLRAAKRIFG